MRLESIALLLVFFCTIGLQAREGVNAQRSPTDYVKEIDQLLRDAGRADISDAEASTRRQRARRLAARYAATLEASHPTGVDQLWLGYLYRLADDTEKAVTTYRAVLKDDSLIEEQKQHVRLFLIRSLSQSGRMEEAQAILAAIPPSAFNADETRAEAHGQLAIAYTDQGQLEKALQHQEQAVAAARKSGLIPRIWTTGRALAQLYVALDRQADAEKLLQELKAFFDRQVRLSGGRPSDALQRAVNEIEAGLAHIELLGKPAPEHFAIKWITGSPTTLTALRGKVVALELWAAWCPDCRAMMPHLRHWHARYAKRGLDILAITRYFGYNGRELNKASRGEEEAFLTKFKRLHNLPYWIAIDDGSRTFTSYHVGWIPQIVIIDRAGLVRFIFTWDTNPALCEYIIKRVLARPAARSNQ